MRVSRWLWMLPLVLVQACDSGKKAGTPTDPEPKPAPRRTVNVIHTSGVTGNPAAGTLTVDSGTTVTYAFTAAPGYGDLQVWLDSLSVPAAGTLRVEGDRVLRVSAWPVPETPSGAAAAAVAELYTGTDPADAYQEVLDRTASAVLRGAADELETLRKAEYAALLAAGPEGMFRAHTALAGKTFTVAGQTGSSTASLVLEGNVTFAQDTVVPTTLIFVNGIFNLEGGAAASAQELLRVVTEAGFGNAQFVSAPNGARPGSPVQVMFHHNPIVNLQNPLESCLLNAAWAYNVAGLADPNADSKSILTRAWDMLSRRVRTAGPCLDFISTNARVATQFLDASLGDLSRPDMQDAGLISRIAAERRRGGGRNVIAVGHSQGSMIVRTAVGAAGPRAEHAGCLGAIGVGSPLATSIEWPNQQWLTRIIARGSESGSHDILFPLGPGRTDGRRSTLTDDLDTALRNGDVVFSIPFRQLALHSFTGSYLAPAGNRAEVREAIRSGYHALAGACTGRLTGTVRDFETGQPISGASVILLAGGQARADAVQTGGDGRFQSPAVYPILHDVVVSAAGYRPDTLPQRLVPFNAVLPAQEGPIYLGKDCVRNVNQVCDISGIYEGYYHLSGSVNGRSVACAFDATLRVTQSGTSFTGTVSTNRYQSGCHESSSNYIEWGQGTWTISGVVEGDRLTMEHPARPPWTLTGRVFASGFQVTQDTWLPGGGYRLRAEISGRRVANVTASLQAAVAPTPGVAPMGVRRR
jgi:hypothetical protein